jgi:DNA-binding GntR family transcriptional regulator
MNEQVFSQITPYSKKDRALGALREAIVSGKLKPGDPIVESRVARQLGVGQPLIREALLELEHQGFVQRVPHRGTSVTKLGPGEIEQIQKLRLELESLALEWARGRATPEHVRELRDLVEGMRQATVEEDLSKFNDFDLALHRRIWQLSGNKYLEDALERAVVPLLTFFYLRSGRVGELHVRSVDHHVALVDALDSGIPARPAAIKALGALRVQCEALAPPAHEAEARYGRA